MERIDRFTGENRWLSNFWPVTVIFEGRTYRSVEAAYVAAKTTDDDERAHIQSLPTSAACKYYGRTQIALRHDWEWIKNDVMLHLLRLKFAPGTELSKRLLATGDCELIEGNDHKDRYWGVYKGKGKNHLGRLLMKVRAELRGEL